MVLGLFGEVVRYVRPPDWQEALPEWDWSAHHDKYGTSYQRHMNMEYQNFISVVFAFSGSSPHKSDAMSLSGNILFLKLLSFHSTPYHPPLNMA